MWHFPISSKISFVFGIGNDKDIVRRVLAKHYRPDPRSGGPLWLTFLGYSKNRLWSMDPFRCDSLILTTHWVMVVVDQFSRRIIGSNAYAGGLDELVV